MHVVTDPIKKGITWVRKKSRTLDEILYVFRYLRNPADATYEIKRKNRVSILSATLLLLVYFGFYVFYIYELGFLFNPRDISEINLLEEILRIFLPLLLFVFANYLIGSIREGEGRLKDVYITTIFSVTPYFLVLPFLAILSQGLTFNEAFLIQFVQFIGLALSVVYFFFMVKETHYYSLKETTASILISFFTMLMLLLGSFIIYILLSELATLLVDLVLEVFYRV